MITVAAVALGALLLGAAEGASALAERVRYIHRRAQLRAKAPRPATRYFD